MIDFASRKEVKMSSQIYSFFSFQRSHEVLDVDCITKLTGFDVVMRPPGSDLKGGAGCVPVKASSYHLTYHQNLQPEWRYASWPMPPTSCS